MIISIFVVNETPKKSHANDSKTGIWSAYLTNIVGLSNEDSRSALTFASTDNTRNITITFNGDKRFPPDSRFEFPKVKISIKNHNFSLSRFSFLTFTYFNSKKISISIGLFLPE